MLAENFWQFNEILPYSHSLMIFPFRGCLIAVRTGFRDNWYKLKYHKWCSSVDNKLKYYCPSFKLLPELSKIAGFTTHLIYLYLVWKYSTLNSKYRIQKALESKWFIITWYDWKFLYRTAMVKLKTKNNNSKCYTVTLCKMWDNSNKVLQILAFFKFMSQICRIIARIKVV